MFKSSFYTEFFDAQPANQTTQVILKIFHGR